MPHGAAAQQTADLRGDAGEPVGGEERDQEHDHAEQDEPRGAPAHEVLLDELQ